MIASKLLNSGSYIQMEVAFFFLSVFTLGDTEVLSFFDF